MMNKAFLRNLLKEEKGTSILELAIIAPVLAMLTIGIIDLSNGIARKLELAQAVSLSVERVAVGDFEIPEDEAGNPDFSFLVEDAVKAAKVEAADVTVTRWLECNGEEQEGEASFHGECPLTESRPECAVSNPPPNLGCKPPPILSRYVQVRIDSSYKPIFGTLVAPAADGTFALSARAAVRIQ
jgi:Flp pilus assembly pilin Flp